MDMYIPNIYIKILIDINARNIFLKIWYQYFKYKKPQHINTNSKDNGFKYTYKSDSDLVCWI